MSRFGKCQNLSGCLLAYRGEETEVEKDQPFICAECGKALVEVKSPAALWMRYVYGLGAVVVAAGIAFAVSPKLRTLIVKHKEHHEPGERTSSSETTDNSTSTSTADNSTSSSTNPPGPDTNPSAPVGEPPKFVTSPQRIDLDITKQENKEVKAEVLTRIDLMPNISAANKDKLYNAVERARQMGKVLTIPFGSGKTELSSTDLEALKTELDKPDLANLRGDPTAVFVILGYADPKGDAKKNIAISQNRADAVLRAMKDKCGVINVMHTVGMGGSKLLDAQNLEKNRIVEVWAVLP
ncbi:MAG TPA: OmpA family protein [Chthoniobacter sp.]|jgi:outer membrane protein OmpA-like peptidoglycan-associated protein